MSKRLKVYAFTSLFLLASTTAKASGAGIVNFSTIVADSKHGKQEQENFEALKKQMNSLLEETEKQLSDIAGKFNDPDYLDGLSPEGEAELKMKYQQLSEEMNRYQNQYYQVMQQANMKLMYNMSAHINEASEKVAKRHKHSMILNKEACFYYDPKLDITGQIMDEMNIAFDKDEQAKKMQAAPQPTPVKDR